jgi:hypothetical protein
MEAVKVLRESLMAKTPQKGSWRPNDKVINGQAQNKKSNAKYQENMTGKIFKNTHELMNLWDPGPTSGSHFKIVIQQLI